MSFEVRVVNDDDEGLEGIRVRLEFTELSRGISDEEYTDPEGSAYFEDYDEGPVKIYINGRDFGEYLYEDGSCITINK